MSTVTIRYQLRSPRVTKSALPRCTYVNTLRDLLRRARNGQLHARKRASSNSLSEEYEVLASSATVRDLGSA